MAQCNTPLEATMQVRDTTAFDAWLHDMMTTTFDAALHEPVPDELLAIIAAAPELA